MIPTKLPPDTTQEQWERYEEDLKKHEEFIKQYRFFLDRICSHLDFKNPPDKTWTTAEIRKTITSEIDMASSCDAPNEPGYYRANND